ncbi:hypothetical protein GOBAR_AA18196 [Gossypium barbadense]|uniref:Uncharacterized protein n=1 Tax=Gossypium barbadense TaxID=3634 RepID=A0A2P5XGJ2_GOSBA|nr:hypothetical protein GOBAR_AA18196 [Gossypium barbadense]
MVVDRKWDGGGDRQFTMGGTGEGKATVVHERWAAARGGVATRCKAKKGESRWHGEGAAMGRKVKGRKRDDRGWPELQGVGVDDDYG